MCPPTQGMFVPNMGIEDKVVWLEKMSDQNKNATKNIIFERKNVDKIDLGQKKIKQKSLRPKKMSDPKKCSTEE